MRTFTAAALAASLAASFALPAQADETEGLILAYDRIASVVVMTDMTVWELPTDLDIPADLGAGDQIRVEYDSAGEDGLTAINVLTRLAAAQK